jgi:hypothetical protein
MNVQPSPVSMRGIAGAAASTRFALRPKRLFNQPKRDAETGTAMAAKTSELTRMKVFANHVDLTDNRCADTRELLRGKPDETQLNRPHLSKLVHLGR